MKMLNSPMRVLYVISYHLAFEVEKKNLCMLRAKLMNGYPLIKEW